MNEKKRLIKKAKESKVVRVRTSLFLDENLLNGLKAECEKLDINQSTILEILIKEFLDMK